MLKARIVHCAKVCPHTFHRYRHPRLRLRLVHLPREQERYLRKLWLRHGPFILLTPIGDKQAALSINAVLGVRDLDTIMTIRELPPLFKELRKTRWKRLARSTIKC